MIRVMAAATVLYMVESFTFRVLSPEAAVPLRYARGQSAARRTRRRP
ncbi:MAG TPA: hypothetical protein QF804_03680 [Rhodospirillales bacterium]|nr:hypothetical protein [Rhodospirillales bacterium]